MIIVIIGPTSVGKTKLSVELAKHYQTEIISGDSVQIYQDLNIGTAKVTESEKQGIKHHMIDILKPTEEYSVALYQKDVRKHLNDLLTEGKKPILVGGTGFYIKSVLHDFDFSLANRPHTFDEHYAHLSNKELFDLLKKHDPEATLKLHKNNRHRVLQALYRALHSTKRSEQTNQDTKVFPYLMIGLTLPKETLYDRINQRVDTMFHQGLVEEVKALYDQNIKGQSMQAIGYKEMVRFFNQELTLSEAKDLIKRNSRRYAKRQYTYFKNQFDVEWFNVNLDDFSQTIQAVIKYIDAHLNKKPS